MTQATSELDARIEMKAFIDRCRAPYADWYANVAADAQRRVEAHGCEANDWYIHRRLASPEAAQRVLQTLVDLGCQTGGELPAGEGEPEDEEAPVTSVYAYWKRDHTTP
jgi:hypothetical protein